MTKNTIGDFTVSQDDMRAMETKVSSLNTKVNTIDSRVNVISNQVANKVDKVEGMGLSSNDFTNSLLGKLKAIEDGAQVNIIEKIDFYGCLLFIEFCRPFRIPFIFIIEIDRCVPNNNNNIGIHFMTRK